METPGKQSATARSLFIIKIRGNAVKIQPHHPLAVRRVYELVYPDDEATAFPSAGAAHAAAQDCRMPAGSYSVENFTTNQTKEIE